jgi:hypothetical protein
MAPNGSLDWSPCSNGIKVADGRVHLPEEGSKSLPTGAELKVRRLDRSTIPARMKATHNPVAKFEPGNSITDLCDFAGSVGQGHYAALRWATTTAFEDLQIAVIERTREHRTAADNGAPLTKAYTLGIGGAAGTAFGDSHTWVPSGKAARSLVVIDATSIRSPNWGVSHIEMPGTPERVWRLLEQLPQGGMKP